MRTDIIYELAENWVPDRLILDCNDCDTRLLSLTAENMVSETPSDLAERAIGGMTRHRREHDCTDFDITIDKTDPLAEINCEVTVGGVDE